MILDIAAVQSDVIFMQSMSGHSVRKCLEALCFPLPGLCDPAFL